MSIEATAQYIIHISELYTICVGFIILFSGIVGHIANIYAFAHLKIFRGNPSAFYIIAESIVDLLQITISYTSRIAIIGFEDDLTRNSLVWCKLRQFFLQTFTLISLYIVCLAAIDQYLSTNYYPFLRQMSTIKSAKILITLLVIIWIIHGIPFLIFYETDPIDGCTIHNFVYSDYVTFFFYLVLSGFLPIVISTFFSVLAYQNVRRLIRRQVAVRRRKLDQQLTAMIIVRVVFLVLMVLPYAIQRSYALSPLIKDDALVDQAIVQLIGAVTFSFFYLNYAVS